MKKIGLALSSGGARGFSHIGVIKVLLENNIPIDCIAGTSMGAVIAAYYAIFQDVKGMEKIALEFKKRDMLKIVDFNDPRISIIKGDNLRKFLKNIFGDRTFEDTKIPLRLGATSLQDGKSIVFSSGKIVDVIMASGAFPGVFPTVKYKGMNLVDGGLAATIPVEMVKSIGAEYIIAVNLFNMESSENRNYDSIIDVLERTIEILQAQLSDVTLSKYYKNIYVLSPQTGSKLQTFSFYNGKKNVQAGYDEAKMHIKDIIDEINELK